MVVFISFIFNIATKSNLFKNNFWRKVCFYFYLHAMWVSVWVCALSVQAPDKIKRGGSISWNWSYKQLWAARDMCWRSSKRSEPSFQLFEGSLIFRAFLWTSVLCSFLLLPGWSVVYVPIYLLFSWLFWIVFSFSRSTVPTFYYFLWIVELNSLLLVPFPLASPPS